MFDIYIAYVNNSSKSAHSFEINVYTILFIKISAATNGDCTIYC